MKLLYDPGRNLPTPPLPTLSYQNLDQEEWEETQQQLLVVVAAVAAVVEFDGVMKIEEKKNGNHGIRLMTT